MNTSYVNSYDSHGFSFPYSTLFRKEDCSYYNNFTNASQFQASFPPQNTFATLNPVNYPNQFSFQNNLNQNGMQIQKETIPNSANSPSPNVSGNQISNQSANSEETIGQDKTASENSKDIEPEEIQQKEDRKESSPIQNPEVENLDEKKPTIQEKQEESTKENEESGTEIENAEESKGNKSQVKSKPPKSYVALISEAILSHPGIIP